MSLKKWVLSVQITQRHYKLAGISQCCQAVFGGIRSAFDLSPNFVPWCRLGWSGCCHATVELLYAPRSLGRTSPRANLACRLSGLDLQHTWIDGGAQEMSATDLFFFDSETDIIPDFSRSDYNGPPLTDLLDIIAYVKPTALLGLSTIKV